MGHAPALAVGLIWAQSPAGVIGAQGRMPWRLPEDSAHFRTTTTGHPVIMGRRTWQSLPNPPLPGRRNLVLSRRANLHAPGAEVVGSLAEALVHAREDPGGADLVWVIGGADVYAQALPLATIAEVTEVDCDVAGDTYAPTLAGWRLDAAGHWRTSRTGIRFRHLRYRREHS